MHNVSMQACGLPCPSTDAGLTRHAFATIQHVTIDGKNIHTLACNSIGREWEGGIDDARELAGSPEARSDQIMHGRGVLCSRSEL